MLGIVCYVYQLVLTHPVLLFHLLLASTITLSSSSIGLGKRISQ